jgi:hypothetical protein
MFRAFVFSLVELASGGAIGITDEEIARKVLIDTFVCGVGCGFVVPVLPHVFGDATIDLTLKFVVLIDRVFSCWVFTDEVKTINSVFRTISTHQK